MNAVGTNGAKFPAGRSSPSYSPDGAKVVHRCCFFSGGPVTDGIRTANSDGSSPVYLTSGNSDDLPYWQPILVPRRTAFDFDGDSKADISVVRSSNSAWNLLRSTAGLWVSVRGLANDVLVPADYDGDLKTDAAVF